MKANTFAIYKSLVGSVEWTPSTPGYHFAAQAEGQEPVCEIEAPEGWFLVDGMLVKRLNAMDFRAMSATDALLYATTRTHGFCMTQPPIGGNEGEANAEIVSQSSGRAKAIEHARTEPTPRRRGLPKPERNGKV